MIGQMKTRPLGMELVEITPIILGGDASNPQNKMYITRQQHFEMVRYWNKVIRDIHSESDDRPQRQRK